MRKKDLGLLLKDSIHVGARGEGRAGSPCSTAERLAGLPAESAALARTALEWDTANATIFATSRRTLVAQEAGIASLSPRLGLGRRPWDGGRLSWPISG